MTALCVCFCCCLRKDSDVKKFICWVYFACRWPQVSSFEYWNDSSIEPNILLWKNSESFTPLSDILLAWTKSAIWTPKYLAGPRCSETVLSDLGLIHKWWSRQVRPRLTLDQHRKWNSPVKTFDGVIDLVLHQLRKTALPMCSFQLAVSRLWVRCWPIFPYSQPFSLLITYLIKYAVTISLLLQILHSSPGH